MQKFTYVVLFALMALVAWAQADPISDLDPSPTLEVGQSTSVQGLVRFEEHHTIIPLFCAVRPQGIQCARSRPYWSVTLYTDSAQYEIDQKFALDQTTAPEAVELAGQTVRPGEVIRVDATVEYAGNAYYILNNVRNVDSVSDFSTLTLPNWNCRGVVDNDTEIRAQVWHEGLMEGSSADHYVMSLSGAQDMPGSYRVFPLASLTDAQGFSSRNRIVYQGESVNANVKLVIDRSAASVAAFEDGPAPLPGRLQFTLSAAPSANNRIQAQGDYPVMCSRMR